jgi:hypothetical protein
MEVLLSSSIPSAVVPALPFVLLTTDLRVVSPATVQSEALPPLIQVTKVYLSSSIDSMKDEFMSVRQMGMATAEEWLKGLEVRGKEQRNDAARWEKWTGSGGLSQIRPTAQQQSVLQTLPSNMIPRRITRHSDGC